MEAPVPALLRETVISAVRDRAGFDLAPIRAGLLARLMRPVGKAGPVEEAGQLADVGPSEAYVWPREERIAEDVIDAAWSDELIEACRRGLAETHEFFLRSAACCLEADADLTAKGCESWIAGAIRHQLAFDAVWDTLDDRHRIERRDRGRRLQGDDGLPKGTVIAK